jgi:hypothetical protein
VELPKIKERVNNTSELSQDILVADIRDFRTIGPINTRIDKKK